MLRKLFYFIVTITILAVVALLVTPYFLKLDKYKTALLVGITRITGLQAEIEGNIEISLFPRPVIKVTEISLPNMRGASSSKLISVSTVEVEPSIDAIMNGEVDLKNITLIGAVIELESLDSGKKNWQIITQGNNGITNASAKLPKLIALKEGTIIYRNGDKEVSLENMDAEITLDSIVGPFKAKGKFYNNATPINFDLNVGSLDKNSKSDLTMFSDNFNIIVNGDYSHSKTPSMKGNIDATTEDLSKAVAEIFDPESVFSNIKSKESLNFHSSFSIDATETKFAEISLDSDSIKAKGDVKVNYKNSPIWETKLSFEKIDLDRLGERINKQSQEEYWDEDPTNNVISNYQFDVSKDLSAVIEFDIASLIYNKNKVSNIRLESDIFNGEAIIYVLKADLPGKSKFDFAGNIKHNDVRPMLFGEMAISGENFRDVLLWLNPEFKYMPEKSLKDYFLRSNITMTPKIITFSNVNGAVDRVQLSGLAEIRPDDIVSDVKLSFTIGNLDFDSYNITDRIYDKVDELSKELNDIDLESSWLKLFKYRLRGDFLMENLTFNKNIIDQLNTNIRIEPGVLNVQRFSLLSYLSDINARFQLDINSDKPNFDLQIASNQLDASLFSRSGNEAKASDDTKPKKDQGFSWSKDKFNIYALDKLSGRIAFNVKSLRNKELVLDDVDVVANLASQILSFEKAEAVLNEGVMKLSGKIGFNKTRQSIGVSFSLKDFELAELQNIFGDNAPMIDGKATVVGTFNSFGVTPLEWANRANVKIRTVGRDITFQNFDLKSIMYSAPKLLSALDLDAIVKQAMVNGSTNIESISGDVLSQNGILKTANVNFRTDRAVGKFAGNLNMTNLNLAAVTQFSFKPEINKIVNLKMQFKGPLYDVEKTIDTSELENYITGKAAR